MHIRGSQNPQDLDVACILRLHLPQQGEYNYCQGLKLGQVLCLRVTHLQSVPTSLLTGNFCRLPY